MFFKSKMKIPIITATKNKTFRFFSPPAGGWRCRRNARVMDGRGGCFLLNGTNIQQ